MAITNLNKILKEQQQQYNRQGDDEEKDKVLYMMYKYMEESFSKMFEFLDIVNKNQVLLLKKLEELEDKE